MAIRNIAIAAVLLLGAANSHAAERQFKPVPGDGQSVRFERGLEMLFAETSRAGMFVALLPRDKKTGYLWIGVQNRSERQFNVDEGIFRVTGNGIPLRLLGLADRAASVAKGQRLRSIGLMLAAGARGYVAGSGGGQSNYSGTVQSNGSWATFNYDDY